MLKVNEIPRATDAQMKYIKKLLLERGHDGLSTDMLVKLAEPSNSPINNLFMWDNRRAGHLYRLRQAARLLRACVGWSPTKKRPDAQQTNVSVLVTPEPGAAARHIATSYALDDEHMRQDLISRRISAVRNAIKQLLVVPELRDLYAKLDEAIVTYKPNDHKH